MPKKPAVPVLQVLWEPWPDSGEGAWNRDGYEAFAGWYWLDALEPDGTFQNKGYRAMFAGCTTCRRDASDPRVHVPNINDLKPEAPRRKCPTWKTVESVVKSFGGWKKVHYVELKANEGLHWQPIPQRRRVIEACQVCGGTGLGKTIEQDASGRISKRIFPPCDAGCGSYTYGGRGEVQIRYEGPVRMDRHGMTAEQKRIRI